MHGYLYDVSLKLSCRWQEGFIECIFLVSSCIKLTTMFNPQMEVLLSVYCYSQDFVCIVTLTMHNSISSFLDWPGRVRINNMLLMNMLLYNTSLLVHAQWLTICLVEYSFTKLLWIYPTWESVENYMYCHPIHNISPFILSTK